LLESGTGKVSIADLEANSSATVCSIAEVSDSARQRLMALGIVPGERITVEQCYPAFVVRVGWTRVALDKETAAKILVIRDGEDDSNTSELASI